MRVPLTRTQGLGGVQGNGHHAGTKARGHEYRPLGPVGFQGGQALGGQLVFLDVAQLLQFLKGFVHRAHGPPRGGGQLPLGGRAVSRGLQAGHQVKLRAAQAHAMYPPLRSIREHYIPAGEQMQEKPRRRLTKKGVSFTIDKPWGAFAPPMLAASYA